MISLAFYAFLRPSEYCNTPSDHHLRMGDVKISKNKRYCYLRLRSFKHSTTPAIIGISEAWTTSVPICQSLQRYLDLHTNCSPNDPLFDMPVGKFRNLLTKVCKSLQIKKSITPHCFRHGGASWANKKGWSTARITAHGRWNSCAYNTYLKPY